MRSLYLVFTQTTQGVSEKRRTCFFKAQMNAPYNKNRIFIAKDGKEPSISY